MGQFQSHETTVVSSPLKRRHSLSTKKGVLVSAVTAKYDPEAI